MLIDDPELFCLVVPTFEGTPFLRRCLEYLRRQEFGGQILLCDDSSGEHRAFVEGCPAQYPELWLEVDLYPHPTPFLTKLQRSFERLGARYVMLCGHDDFIVPQGVERLLERLHADTELAAAHGRIGRFRIRRANGGQAELELLHFPVYAFESADTTERVLSHLHGYSATLYAVNRREILAEAFARTQSATSNVVFFQYLSSCLVVARGRVACIDEMYFVRQAHERSWAVSLRSDYEHWPLLITSPAFSTYYGEFRNAVLGLLCDARSPRREELARRFDIATADLLRRGLSRVVAPDPESLAFMERVRSEGSVENATMRAIVSFVSEFPETW